MRQTFEMRWFLHINWQSFRENSIETYTLPICKIDSQWVATGTIAQFEGRELRAYQDIVHVWTICDGETKGVHAGQIATPAECDAMLARNIILYEGYLDRCLTAPVPGKMKVALVSWTLNVGGNAVCHGGPGGGPATVVVRANAGNLTGACDALLSWNRAGGKPVQGLTNRRQAERQLCLEGVREGDQAGWDPDQDDWNEIWPGESV